MTGKDTPKKPAKTGKTREDRLKQALKANLARRKAQTRARSGTGAGSGKTEQDKG